MTRRFVVSFVRSWPGLAIIAIVSMLAFILGFKHGYYRRMSEEARSHTVWFLDQ